MSRIYRELHDLATLAARETGDWLAAQFGEKIASTPKGDDSVVTALDIAAERMIVDRIRAAHPDHSIIGEESAPHEGSGAVSWVIDPIDGTRNFAEGIPLWAVSIGAFERGRPVAAAIYLPVTRELYHAVAGEGAWLGEATLRVNETVSLSDAVLMTDLLRRDFPEGLPGGRLGPLATAGKRTRMFGSVCCAMCYVAAGRYDLYYRPQVSVWDVAAGVLIVREAGGEARSFHTGEPWAMETGSILTANATLTEQFLAEKRRLESA